MFSLVPLREVCDQERKTVRSGERPDLRYLGLESIEPRTGNLAQGELSKTPEAPEANAFAFSDMHVLYGKLRPYLNKVYLPAFNGKCSTELIPLRPNERVHREYLAFFLRAPATAEKISQRVAGARMPRAEMSFVMSLPIPLPPMEEQRRIVGLLSRAENIVRMRREAEQKAKELIPALFLEMFGDPATNPKCWPVGRFGDVIESAQYGTSTKASADGAGLPMIRMGNVDFGGRMTLDDLKFVVLSPEDVLKCQLVAGDILFNRTNSKDLVGKTGIWRENRDAVAASYFIRVRVDQSKVGPDYLWAFMNSRHMKKVLFATARGAIGQSNINAQELRAIDVPIPPIRMQRRFASFVVQTLGLENQQLLATLQADQASQSLLAGVFGQIERI